MSSRSCSAACSRFEILPIVLSASMRLTYSRSNAAGIGRDVAQHIGDRLDVLAALEHTGAGCAAT